MTLNIKSWAKHNPHMKIVLLNDSNVKEYIPDMPEEFFKMPYQAAKSDVIRAGSIYHHGGLYVIIRHHGPLKLGCWRAGMLACVSVNRLQQQHTGPNGSTAAAHRPNGSTAESTWEHCKC